MFTHISDILRLFILMITQNERLAANKVKNKNLLNTYLHYFVIETKN